MWKLLLKLKKVVFIKIFFLYSIVSMFITFIRIRFILGTDGYVSICFFRYSFVQLNGAKQLSKFKWYIYYLLIGDYLFVIESPDSFSETH